MPEEIQNSEPQSEESLLIAELYPELSGNERDEAVYFLSRYLDLIEQIDARLNG